MDVKLDSLPTVSAWLEKLKADPAKTLASGSVDLTLPLSASLINEMLRASPPPPSSPIKGAALSVLGGNRGVLLLSIDKWPLPRQIEIPLRFEPRLTQGNGVVALVVHLELSGVLGMVLPFVLSAVNSKLPDSLKVDGKTVTLDIARLLNKKGYGGLVPMIRNAELNDSPGVLTFKLTLSAP